MTRKGLWGPLLLLVSLAFAGCAPRSAAARPSASIEPLAISQRNTSAADGWAVTSPARSSDTKDLANPTDEAAIKRAIAHANNMQAEAFAKKDLTLMRDTAVDSYY